MPVYKVRDIIIHCRWPVYFGLLTKHINESDVYPQLIIKSIPNLQALVKTICENCGMTLL